MKNAQALLSRAENRVLPTEYYQGAENIEAAEKLHKLLAGAYTVIAEEDGELYGLASMDKRGSLGLLYVSGENFKRTAKLLVRALERQADKKGVAQISVLPTDDAVKIFKECGYLKSTDAGKNLEDGGEIYLKTVVPEKAPIEFPPEKVKRFTLDPRKAIKIEGKLSILPALFLGIVCFFALILTVLGIAAKRGSPNVYGAENIPLFAVIIGIMFAAALALFAAYLIRGAKLKRQVLTMTVTNAVVTEVFSETYWTYDRDGDSERHERLTLHYLYYDENMQLRSGSFTHKYSRAPDYYEGQEIVIACSGGFSYILCKYTVLSVDEISE